MIPPGLEPGTLRVLGARDNHYTTETWSLGTFVVDKLHRWALISQADHPHQFLLLCDTTGYTWCLINLFGIEARGSVGRANLLLQKSAALYNNLLMKMQRLFVAFCIWIRAAFSPPLHIFFRVWVPFEYHRVVCPFDQNLSYRFDWL